MATRIPFTNKQASGLEELAGSSPVAFNVLTEPNGTLRRRPGFSAASGLAPSNQIDADGIEALYVSLAGRVFAVGGSPSGRRIYSLSSGGSLDLSSGVSGQSLQGALRPQIAETEMLLLVTGGAEIQKVTLDDLISARLGGSPPKATHVLANASRLLANDVAVDRTKVRYSDLAIGTTSYAGHEVWGVGIGTAGFFTAEASPDPVVAIGGSTSEVIVFGSQTTQFFSSDPSLVFAPVATTEIGCGAPYSIVKVDEQYFMVDDRRRIIQLNGRSYTDISAPIRRTLEEMSDVSDCFGYRVQVGPFDVLVWTFPSAGKTFAYQVGVGWSQWASYGDNWLPCQIAAVARHQNGTILAGLSTGYVGALELDSPLDETGAPLRAYVETGYISHGTEKRKLCKSVHFSLRRGQPGAASKARFGWRDQPGPWTAELEIELAPQGDTEVVVPFYSLGVYRRREWFFEFSGTDELSLVGAEEDFEVLEV